MRIEIGPRDLQKNAVIAAQRATGNKVPVPIPELASVMPAMLEEIQSFLFKKALAARNNQIKTIKQ